MSRAGRGEQARNALAGGSFDRAPGTGSARVKLCSSAWKLNAHGQIRAQQQGLFPTRPECGLCVTERTMKSGEISDSLHARETNLRMKGGLLPSMVLIGRFDYRKRIDKLCSRLRRLEARQVWPTRLEFRRIFVAGAAGYAGMCASTLCCIAKFTSITDRICAGDESASTVMVSVALQLPDASTRTSGVNARDGLRSSLR
jgi:hypothetical protein